MKTPEQIANEVFDKDWNNLSARKLMVAAIEADRAQRDDDVSTERKKIAAMLQQQGDRMEGEGTQAGYYAAAYLVRERERDA